MVLYPEIALTAAEWLKRTFGQPVVKTVPIGVGATRAFVEEVAGLADDRVVIPMSVGAESLNVAAAAAICLYQSARAQRQSLG